MKKILIFSLFLVFGLTTFGQSIDGGTLFFPNSAEKEGFANNPVAGIWTLHTLDWVLSQGTDNRPWTSALPTGVQDGSNPAASGFAWARPNPGDAPIFDEYSFTTPGDLAQVTETVGRIVIDNDATTQVNKYKVVFDWKNDFRSNGIMNRAWSANDPNPLEGFNNANVRLMLEYTGYDDDGGSAIVGAAQLWNEDFPDRTHAAFGRPGTADASYTVGIVTYLRDDPSFTWPGLAALDAYPTIKDYYTNDSVNGFDDASEYEQRFGGFTDAGVEEAGLISGSQWWRTEIWIAGDDNDLPLTLQGSNPLSDFYDNGVRTSGNPGSYGQSEDTKVGLVFKFVYDTDLADNGDVTNGGLGGAFAIDNFAVVLIQENPIGAASGDIEINLYGRAVDMATDYEDSSIFYTMIPMNQIPGVNLKDESTSIGTSGYSLEVDIDNEGVQFANPTYYLEARVDHSSPIPEYNVTNPDGNIIAYAEVSTVSGTAGDNSVNPLIYNFESAAVSNQYLLDDFDEDVWYTNLKVVRPVLPTQNPLFNPIDTGDYTIYFKSTIDENVGDHAEDTVEVHMTKSVLAKDNGVVGSTVSKITLRTGMGSLFKLEREDILSHVDIFFENNAAIEEEPVVIYIYEIDGTEYETNGNVVLASAVDSPVKLKQFQRGTGGVWQSYPDVPGGASQFKTVLAPGYYMVLVEQRTINGYELALDTEAKGVYYTYESKTTDATMFTRETGGVPMIRLNFQNNAPIFETDAIADFETPGVYEFANGNVNVVDDILTVPAEARFTYTFTVSDIDNKNDELSLSFNSDVVGEFLTLTTSGASVTYDPAAPTYGKDGGKFTAKLIGQGIKTLAGIYDVELVVSDAMGNAYDFYDSTIQAFQIQLLVTSGIEDLDYVNEFGDDPAEWEDTDPSAAEDWELVDSWFIDQLYSESPGDQSHTWVRGSVYEDAGYFPANEIYTDAIAITAQDYDGVVGVSADQEEYLISPLLRIPLDAEEGSLILEFDYVTDLKNMRQGGEVLGVFNTGNPVFGFNQADVKLVLSTDQGATWSEPIWSDMEASAGLTTDEAGNAIPRTVTLDLDNLPEITTDLRGELIQIAFVYESSVPADDELIPGYFALTSFSLVVRTADESVGAQIQIASDFWDEIAYKTPIAQIDPNGYEFSVDVINTGDTDVNDGVNPDTERFYLTVDVEYKSTATEDYTRQFRNYWVVPGDAVDAGIAVNFATADLINTDEPDMLNVEQLGFYKVTYKLYDFETRFTFPNGALTLDYEFVVTTNELRPDNYFQDSIGMVSIFSQMDPADVPEYLGGSVGNEFTLLAADKPSNIKIYLPADEYKNENVPFEFSVSLLSVTDTDTSLMWTSEPIEVNAGQTTVESKAYPDAFATLPTLQPGEYIFMVNQFPGHAFNLFVGEGGNRYENWLDGQHWNKVDGKFWDDDNQADRKGAFMMSLIFDTESEMDPYYVGAPWSMNSNYVYHIYDENSSVAQNESSIEADNYDGDFIDFELYQGVTSYYLVEGHDENGDALQLEIINQPDNWVSIAAVPGTDDTWQLVFDTPEDAVLENDYVVIKMTEAYSGTPARPNENNDEDEAGNPEIDKDGTRTIHIFIAPQPDLLNGGNEWKEEFAAAPGAFDNNDLGWTWETNGLDLNDIYEYPVTTPFDPEDSYDAEASWHKVTDDAGDTEWHNRMCIYADSRTIIEDDVVGGNDFDQEYDATNYQNEWFLSDMIFLPETDAKEVITLSFEWNNDFFKNNGGQVGELFSGDPVNGYNNADIRLWISTDGGYSYEAQPLWGEDRADLMGTTSNMSYKGAQTKDQNYVTTIDLEPYTGMWVKFAFQYVGRYGGSFCVDDIELKQRLIAEFPDFALVETTNEPFYKTPVNHFIASDLDIQAKVTNNGGDFPYESEIAYVEAELVRSYNNGNSTQTKYHEVSSAIETLEADAVISDLGFPALTGALPVGDYTLSFAVGAEQGAIWDYELEDNFDETSFSITEDLYAICAPQTGATAKIEVFKEEGQSFNLRVQDILTSVGVNPINSNEKFYVTISDANGIFYKSQTFVTDVAKEDAEGTQWFDLRYNAFDGEFNPADDNIIETIEDVDFGVTLAAGTYTVKIHATAAGTVNIERDKCTGNNGLPYIVLEFGAPEIEWDTQPADNDLSKVNPYPYAIAGCYYNSSQNFYSAMGTYTRFNVETNGLDVTLDDFEMKDVAISGGELQGYDWLSFADFKTSNSTMEASANSTVSAVLEGVPNASWLGTYTVKVDVTEDLFNSSVPDLTYDIHIIDALKLVGPMSSSPYEPKYDDFMNLMPGSFEAPIDEARYAGGLLRLNNSTTNAGWQWADPSPDGNTSASITGNGANAWLITPLIYLPELSDPTNKSYRLQYASQNCDNRVEVKISTDGGVSWSTLMKEDDTDKNDSPTDLVKLRLDSYAGADAKIRLAFVVDESLGGTVVKISDLKVGIIELKPSLSIATWKRDDGTWADHVVYKVPYSNIPNEHEINFTADVEIYNGTWLSDDARDLNSGEGSIEVMDYRNHDNPKVTFGPLNTGSKLTVSVDVQNKSSNVDRNGLRLRVRSNSDDQTDNTYDFDGGDTDEAENDGPFGTNDNRYRFPRFKENNKGIYGIDKAYDFWTSDLSTTVNADGKELSYEIRQEDWLSYILVLMPDANANSNDMITFYIDDNKGEVYTQSFAINEGLDFSTAINGSSLADQTVTVGAVQVPCSWRAYDIDDVKLDANSTVSVKMQVDGSLQVCGDTHFDGTVAMRLFLTNMAPVISNIEDHYDYPVCSNISITVQATDDHDAASDIDFAISGANTDWLTITNNNDGTATISGSATAEHIGLNHVTVTAADSENSKGAIEFVLQIHDIDPEFTSTPDQGGSSVVEGMTYEYVVSAEDNNKDKFIWDGSASLTTSYSLVQAPAGMTIAGDLISWTPSGVVGANSESRDYEVIVEATIDAGCVSEKTQQTYMLTVFKNYAPVMNNVADVWTYVGADFSLQISATDQNEDALSYTASPLPSGLSIDAATGIISGTPAQNEDVEVTASASDGLLSSAPVTFIIHVTGEVNDQLSVAISNDTAAVGERVMIPVIATEGAQVSLVKSEATFLNLVTIDGQYVISGVETTNPADTMVYEVVVSATDNVTTVEGSCTVTIIPNLAPSVNLNLDSAYTVGTTATIEGTLSDPEGDAINVISISAPQWLAIEINGSSIVGTVDLENLKAGEAALVEIIISDGINTVAYSQEIDVDGIQPIAVEDVDGAEISVFPNPATAKINVAGAKIGSEILLINATGQVLARETVTKDVVELKTSSYSSGLYMIQVDGITHEVIISNK